MTENITVNEQNSIQIKDRSGMIYVDPFRIRERTNDAAFIFITHDHYDHYSPEDIAKVAKEDTILIVPEKMEGKAREVSGLVGRTVTVRPGMQQELEGLFFETVPAYNILKPFHPKSAMWVGYIFLVEDRRIYVAGDTDATAEAKAVKCDIALVPVGGTYTMDAKKAAQLVNTIGPDVAIPVHYGTLVGSMKDGQEFAENVNDPVRVELKIPIGV
ncbi:MAG: MBL fold metallo-hydrolase [Lachnospiraceae bacterium]|nr:MBL fold metallo-hydrolase [Lachnospiraceae bacterium]